MWCRVSSVIGVPRFGNESRPVHGNKEIVVLRLAGFQPNIKSCLAGGKPRLCRSPVKQHEVPLLIGRHAITSPPSPKYWGGGVVIKLESVVKRCPFNRRCGSWIGRYRRRASFLRPGGRYPAPRHGHPWMHQRGNKDTGEEAGDTTQSTGILGAQTARMCGHGPRAGANNRCAGRLHRPP